MKRLILIILAAAMLLSLAACGGDAGEGAPIEAGSWSLTTLSSEADTSCATADGWYYIDKHDYEFNVDGLLAYHLMYIDYATRQEVFLCSNSGCKHDTADCTAVIANADIGANQSLFMQDGALYLLDAGYDMDGTSSYSVVNDGFFSSGTQSRPTVLYRMNADGSGREKVYEFDAGLTVESTVFGCAKGLCFVTKRVDSEAVGETGATVYSATERKLMLFDTSKHTLFEAAALDLNTGSATYSLIGASRDLLVFCGYEMARELTDDELLAELTDPDFSSDVAKSSTDSIVTLNVATGEKKTILSIPNSVSHSFELYGDTLYWSKESEGCVYSQPLDGEAVKLADVENDRIWDVFSGVVLCRAWDSFDGDWFIDIETGAISHSALKTKSIGWPIEIKAASADGFLVLYDFDADSNGDDSYSIHKNKYALISRADLFSGNANYQPIAMVGTGLAN